MYQISKKTRTINGNLDISGSKSESNRLLILRAYTSFFNIINLSDSDDTNIMSNALDNDQKEVNIGHAGTAMRFLTSYFSSIKNSSKILTGSTRMKQRPISILVNSLKELGAEISYTEKDGFPPIKIEGKLIKNNSTSLPANISSQFLSSLMMLGTTLKDGLKINLISDITSLPYVIMTKQIIERIGGKVSILPNRIIIQKLKSKEIEDQVVESDWSSASYFYSLVALSYSSDLTLKKYFKKSIQGDSKLVEIYSRLGVKTTYKNGKIILTKNSLKIPSKISLNLIENPDLAQTIIVTCLGLGIDCYLNGLHTLKIKETDRLSALKNEIQKFGVDKVEITKDSIRLVNKSPLKSNVRIDTYNDHRMAMSFAPLSIIKPISIMNPEVISKSYKNFWLDLESLGFTIYKNK